MEVLKIDEYKDGGTIEIITNRGCYCIDDRLFSKTKGNIFCNYPKDDNSNIASNQDELKLELFNAVAKYTIGVDIFNWIPKMKELLDISELVCEHEFERIEPDNVWSPFMCIKCGKY